MTLSKDSQRILLIMISCGAAGPIRIPREAECSPTVGLDTSALRHFIFHDVAFPLPPPPVLERNTPYCPPPGRPLPQLVGVQPGEFVDLMQPFCDAVQRTLGDTLLSIVSGSEGATSPEWYAPSAGLPPMLHPDDAALMPPELQATPSFQQRAQYTGLGRDNVAASAQAPAAAAATPLQREELLRIRHASRSLAKNGEVVSKAAVLQHMTPTSSLARSIGETFTMAAALDADVNAFHHPRKAARAVAAVDFLAPLVRRRDADALPDRVAVVLYGRVAERLRLSSADTIVPPADADPLTDMLANGAPDDADVSGAVQPPTSGPDGSANAAVDDAAPGEESAEPALADAADAAPTPQGRDVADASMAAPAAVSAPRDPWRQVTAAHPRWLLLAPNLPLPDRAGRDTRGWAIAAPDSPDARVPARYSVGQALRVEECGARGGRKAFALMRPRPDVAPPHGHAVGRLSTRSVGVPLAYPGAVLQPIRNVFVTCATDRLVIVPPFSFRTDYVSRAAATADYAARPLMAASALRADVGGVAAMETEIVCIEGAAAARALEADASARHELHIPGGNAMYADTGTLQVLEQLAMEGYEAAFDGRRVAQRVGLVSVPVDLPVPDDDEVLGIQDDSD